MRGTLSVLILAILPPATPLLRAQQDINPESQAGHSVDITRPYEPPSAFKSVEIGNFYLKKKNYRAALSRFQEAATTEPDYAPAYLGLGQVYEKIGLKQKALASYHKYLDELPSKKQADEAKDAHKAIERLEHPSARISRR
jgi:tetratricopeptide (TPR) repeat protein